MNKSTPRTNIIKAYGNKVKANIIHLLNIYDVLTTMDLANKLGKSKTTILRNIEELIKLKIVSFEEESGLPGKYPRRKYQIAEDDLSVRGKDYEHIIFENPEFILEFNQYRQGMYTLVNNITTSSVNYLKRLRLEFEKVLDNPAEILKLQKDNLGSLKYKYLTRKELEVRNGITIEHERDEDKENPKKPYLEITILLPIERLVETDTRKDWKKDGTLWFYDD